MKLKVGDKVFSLKNHVWGKTPMEITRIWDETTIQCKHPTMGIGSFSVNDLAKSSSKKIKDRMAKLKKIEKIQLDIERSIQKIGNLQSKIFPGKY